MAKMMEHEMVTRVTQVLTEITTNCCFPCFHVFIVYRVLQTDLITIFVFLSYT